MLSRSKFSLYKRQIRYVLIIKYKWNPGKATEWTHRNPEYIRKALEVGASVNFASSTINDTYGKTHSYL